MKINDKIHEIEVQTEKIINSIPALLDYAID